MKETLLVLLIFCANIAFAQHHIEVDPTGSKLTLKEEQSIQKLIAEITAKAADHTAAQMASFQKDYQNHLVHTAGLISSANAVSYNQLQNMLLHLPNAAQFMSTFNIQAHVEQINNVKDPFGDIVKLTAMFQAQHALFLELHMNPRNGNYILQSVQVK